MNAPAEHTIGTLAAAWVKAFAEIDAAVKNAANPHFKSKFADLSAVIGAIKPHLSAHGLAFVQISHPHERGVQIETVLIHESGEQMSLGAFYVPATKNDPQGYGSASSYCRRFALQTAFGLPAVDDDGEEARKAAENGKPAEDYVKSAQDAAMQGMKALTAYWTANQGKPGFGAFWKTYADGLKAAAANADMVSA